MLARTMHRRTICRCGVPKAIAWHPEMDGEFEVLDDHVHTCHACTALARYGAEGEVKPVEYLSVANTRSAKKGPLPPLPTERRRAR